MFKDYPLKQRLKDLFYSKFLGQKMIQFLVIVSAIKYIIT